MTDSFYQILLTNLIKEVEAGIRMLEDTIAEDLAQGLDSGGKVAIRLTLRRALTEAKGGIRSYENE